MALSNQIFVGLFRLRFQTLYSRSRNTSTETYQQHKKTWTIIKRLIESDQIFCVEPKFSPAKIDADLCWANLNQCRNWESFLQIFYRSISGLTRFGNGMLLIFLFEHVSTPSSAKIKSTIISIKLRQKHFSRSIVGSFLKIFWIYDFQCLGLGFTTYLNQTNP